MGNSIFGSTFIIILPLQALGSISSCMNRTETCPTKDYWNIKNNDYNCANNWQYVCMLSKEGLLFEGCMPNKTIRFGTYGCPFVEQCDENLGFQLIAHEKFIPCEKLEQCPRKNYTGVSIFHIKEFPECYVPKQNITSEIIAGVITTSPIKIQEETSIIGSGILAVALIVLIVIIIIGVILILKYRQGICFRCKKREFDSKSNSCEEDREANINEEDSFLKSAEASSSSSKEQAKCNGEDLKVISDGASNDLLLEEAKCNGEDLKVIHVPDGASNDLLLEEEYKKTEVAKIAAKSRRNAIRYKTCGQMPTFQEKDPSYTANDYRHRSKTTGSIQSMPRGRGKRRAHVTTLETCSGPNRYLELDGLITQPTQANDEGENTNAVSPI